MAQARRESRRSLKDKKMDQFSKDGRKLRPRKKAISGNGTNQAAARPAYSTGEHDTQNYGERRPYGERKPYGGERRQYGEHKSYGDHKPYGEHRQYGERHSYGEHRSYNSFGDQRPYDNGERSGEGTPRKQYGAKSSYNRKPYGNKPYGSKSSTGKGPRKSEGKRPQRGGFNKESNEGINRMIQNTPRPAPQYSDFDSAPTPIKEEIRLNKFIANSGVCSRREADTMIQAGVVTVNGEVVTEMGTKININKDVVKFNGETLKGEAKVYLVMNKPRGFVTTASDPHAEKTVMDLLKGCTARVYPVGRLDKATTGVLMFTNDGEIAERLTHPSYDKKKIYQVILNKPLEEADRQRILDGIELSDGTIAADALEYIDDNDKRKLGIEIHSGKNRVVRRIFEATGHEVRTLDRVYFAGLTKKGLKKGEWRYLTEAEVNILKMGAYV